MSATRKSKRLQHKTIRVARSLKIPVSKNTYRYMTYKTGSMFNRFEITHSPGWYLDCLSIASLPLYKGK